MTRRVGRLLVALLVAAVGIIVVSGAAGAAAQCFTAPSGDSAGPSGGDSRADIVEHCISIDGATVTVSMRLAASSTPTTDPNWNGETAVLWAIGTQVAEDYDFVVVMSKDGAAVLDAETEEPLCAATAVFDAAVLSSSFPLECIGSPSQVWVGAITVYDATPSDSSDAPIIDQSPDGDSMAGPVSTASSGGGGGGGGGPTDPVARLQGSDRIGTAIAASVDAFASGAAQGVVLASSSNYPDALVGVPLAAARTGPVLLTPRDALPEAVLAEIGRVTGGGSKPVFILGGTAAIGVGVEIRLRNAGYAVTRYWGNDRYETAVAVANAIGTPAVILEATGRDFPDALSAGSGAAKAGGVVLLTDGPTQAPATAAYLSSHGSVTRYAVGGAAAAADPSATPVVGLDRYATATRVAQRFFASPAVVGVASGTNYPDALAGGAHAARRGGPLLLTSPAALSPPTAAYLQANKATIAAGWVYGGTVAVSDTTLAAIRQAIT